MSLHEMSLDEVETSGLDRVMENVRLGQAIAVDAHGNRVVLVSEDRFLSLEHLRETQEDIYDAVLALSREMAPAGEGASLDEVIAALGYTREELEALDD